MEWQNKRKPTDRTLEPNVLAKLPDAELFQRLQEVESNLDSLVQRKRLDLQDMIGRSMRKNEIIRLFVSSSMINQAWQEGTPLYTPGEQPTWILRVEGKLVTDGPTKNRAFSSMITSVIVELKNDKPEGASESEMAVEAPVEAQAEGNPEGNPEGQIEGQNDGQAENQPEETPKKSSDEPDEIVEWHETCVPPEQRVDFDGLDVKRPGSEKVKARVLIQLKEYPDKFKLSPQLANILGVCEESKPGAVVSLWQYIRYHKLQDIDEKRLIKCDTALYNLFKREKIMLPQLVELLAPHLTPREPISIEFTIDPTTDLESRDLAFDVPIQIDHPLRGDLLSMLNTWHNDFESINRLEDLLLQDVQALNLLSHQHDFYEDLSKDPVEFLNRWVDSQARDLRVIYCDRQFSEEAVRHSSFYTDDILNPSMHLFLGKQ